MLNKRVRRGSAEPGLPADWLRPDWAAPHVRAFMTTRAGGVSQGPHASMNIGAAVEDSAEAVAQNRLLVSQALGAPAVFLWQVHGTQVLNLQPEHALPGAEMIQADAAICTTPGLGVAIQAADCLPVLLAAPAGVAGAHAGWRGLAGGVLENTVAALCAASHCRPDEIQAWLGACIGPQAFEVGAEVLQAFGAKVGAGGGGGGGVGAADGFVYQANAAGEPRWRANLPALAKQRLQALGLTRISGGDWCTFTQPSRFFSYRHERLSGRMVAVIALR